MDNINNDSINVFKHCITQYNIHEIKAKHLIINGLKKYRSNLASSTVISESDCSIHIKETDLNYYNTTSKNFIVGATGLKNKGIQLYYPINDKTEKYNVILSIKKVWGKDDHIIKLDHEIVDLILGTDSIYTEYLSQCAAGVLRIDSYLFFRMVLNRIEKTKMIIPVKLIRQAIDCVDKYPNPSVFKYQKLNKILEELDLLYLNGKMSIKLDVIETGTRGDFENLAIKPFFKNSIIKSEETKEETKIEKEEGVINVILKTKGSKDFLYHSNNMFTPDSFNVLKKFTRLIETHSDNPNRLFIKPNGINYQIMCSLSDLNFTIDESEENINKIEEAITDLSKMMILDKSGKEIHRYPIFLKPFIYKSEVVYFELFKGLADDLIDLSLSLSREKNKQVFTL